MQSVHSTTDSPGLTAPEAGYGRPTGPAIKQARRAANAAATGAPVTEQAIAATIAAYRHTPGRRPTRRQIHALLTLAAGSAA